MRRLAVIMWHMLSKQEAYRYGGAPQPTRGDCEQPFTEAELAAHRETILEPFAQASAAVAAPAGASPRRPKAKASPRQPKAKTASRHR